MKAKALAYPNLKTARVKYLLNPLKPIITERYLVESEKDLKQLWDSKIIGILHMHSMKKYLAKGEQLIVNNSGGYCPLGNTWEILDKLVMYNWQSDTEKVLNSKDQFINFVQTLFVENDHDQESTLVMPQDYTGCLDYVAKYCNSWEVTETF